MSQVVEEAKAEFTRAQTRIAKSLNATPADKVNWSPSDTARTPLQIVAHAAMSIDGISGMLQGKPFPFSSMEELDTFSRAKEKEFTSVGQVVDLLETSSATYLAWLDTLTDDQVGSTVNFPMGPIPMAFAITFAADHIRCHAAQLDYVQTIYGDYEWRM